MLCTCLLAGLFPQLEASRIANTELVDCPALKTNSEFMGKGENAYTLKLTRSVCQGIKGNVLKAFLREEDRNDAIDRLAELPSIAQLAGLACTKTQKDKCKLEAKCVNAKTARGTFAEASDCFFMRMRHGGGKTLEQCLGQTLTSKKVAQILKKAVEVLATIHDKGWFHRDYQPKNIMLENDLCNSDKLSVIDLDAMGQATDVPKREGEPWNAGHYAWNDYALLFGVCNSGGDYLPTLYKGSEPGLVQDIFNRATNALCPSGAPDSQRWSLTWDVAKQHWKTALIEQLDEFISSRRGKK